MTLAGDDEIQECRVLIFRAIEIVRGWQPGGLDQASIYLEEAMDRLAAYSHPANPTETDYATASDRRMAE